MDNKVYSKNDQIWDRLSKPIIEMIESSNYIWPDIEGIIIILDDATHLSTFVS